MQRVLFLAICLCLCLALAVAYQHTQTAISQPNSPTSRAKFEPEKGVILGAYTEQNALLNNDMALFNQVTNKKHASFFRYVGYGRPFPQEWVDKVKALGAVPNIAWEPNNGLNAVNDDEYLRTFARACKAAEVPMFIRFASEMNGDWTAYSGDPALYIAKWRLVYNVMKEEAPNVAMIWSVFTFPQSTITKYYPGDNYVDWVGVNVYNVVYHNNNIEQRADHEDPLELIRFVYEQYSEKKPIMITEYGVTHYAATDGAEHVSFALEKLARMYVGMQTEFPRIKAIYYFDVNNVKEAVPARRINDYSITNNAEILNLYRRLIADTYFLSDVTQEASSSQ